MEATTTRKTPIQQSQANPRSLRLAVNAKCYECMGGCPSWRKEVENCTSRSCPLYPVRPRSKSADSGR